MEDIQPGDQVTFTAPDGATINGHVTLTSNNMATVMYAVNGIDQYDVVPLEKLTLLCGSQYP